MSFLLMLAIWLFVFLPTIALGMYIKAQFFPLPFKIALYLYFFFAVLGLFAIFAVCLG